MVYLNKKKRYKEIKLCKYTKTSPFVHKKFIIAWYYKHSSKRTSLTDVVMFFITHKFFHNNRPGKPLPGHSSFIRSLIGDFFYFLLHIKYVIIKLTIAK